MRPRHIALSLIPCILILSVTVASAAPVGTAFSYQGQLKNADSPVIGNTNMAFSLWDDPAAGTQQGSTLTFDGAGGNPAPVSVSNGLFTVQLDFGVSPYAANAARWLEIAVNGAMLSPRQPLTPTPFALNTRGLNVDASGNVGIGTTTPGSSLQVNGGLRVRGGVPGALGANNNGYAFSGSGGDNDSGMYSTADGQLEFYTNNIERARISSAGNVGIGLTSPTSRLHVENSIDVFSNPVMRVRNTNGGVTGGHAIRVHTGSGESSMGSWTTWPGTAVFADNNSASGGSSAIRATTRGNRAVSAYADTGTAVYAEIINSGGGGTGMAGDFYGAVDVNGVLSKSGGSFKIDHPLDPEHKYLYHSFVESPDMMNIYNGIVVTDANGYATVTLPDWFDSLNRDFRYQLTVIDEADGPDFVMAKVVRGISGNHFTLRSSAPRTRVSWQVTGIRKDPWAEANRIPVEKAKTGDEVGKYLHPEVFGHDRSKRINFAPSAAPSPAAGDPR